MVDYTVLLLLSVGVELGWLQDTTVVRRNGLVARYYCCVWTEYNSSPC